jgi:3-methyladenine DNA glycosylase AlkD
VNVAAMPKPVPKAVSPTTERARALVASRLQQAGQLGRDVADHIQDAGAATDVLEQGLARLADPEYLEGQRRVAPGIGPLHGVRWPLLAATGRAFRKATHTDPPTPILLLADRLLRQERRETRWFAFGLLERLVDREPERTWQLIRRAARDADDWISVDSLAHAAGRGILAEAYRWAELEQLVFSPSPWERRLVGSTIATIPFIDHRWGRTPDVVSRGIDLVGQLIGDAEPDVQKALSWALRSLAMIDAAAVADFADREARVAASTADGHRAWVIRDALAKLPPERAGGIASRLDGLRRRQGVPSTSRASATAHQFETMGIGRPMPEPPLT